VRSFYVAFVFLVFGCQHLSNKLRRKTCLQNDCYVSIGTCDPM